MASGAATSTTTCPSICGRRHESSAASKRNQLSSTAAVNKVDTIPEDIPSSQWSAARGLTATKRVKGPNEDAWLSTAFDDPNFDRNRLDSLRRVALNPDLLRMRTVHCYCGNDVNLEEHWCVMTNDGTLVCNSCASCHCCSSEALPNSRRLVSIDGMVLCYRCVRFFGHLRRPRIRIRIETLSKDPFAVKKAETETPDSTTTNVSNSEYYDYNVPRTTRCGYNPKQDMRRIFRHRYYSPPVKALGREDDPCDTPPAYLAENLGQLPMHCPTCKNIALGPKAYVVPSMARVYHKHCFRCCNCLESLAYGYKIAGIAFQYCSCDIPFVWCAKPACRAARQTHHKATKCRLGCIRPGGRIQSDYTAEISQDESLRRPKRTKKGKKESTSTRASAANSKKLSQTPNDSSLQTDATLASSECT